MNKVYIVDACMGSGKTSAMINMINKSSDSELFLYVTPLISETERIVKACATKHFIAPKALFSKESKVISKKENLRKLLQNKRNIATTHAMFHLFDDEILDLCRDGGYTLILDETTDVVNKYPMAYHDFKDFMNTHANSKDNGVLEWVDDKDGGESYTGNSGTKFLAEKSLFDFGNVVSCADSCLLYIFPIKAFEAFARTYVLTYLFEGQMQKCYYDFYGVSYEYLYVKGTSPENYEITDAFHQYDTPSKFKSLIHICDNDRMNAIGEAPNSLSKSWFQKNSKKKDAEEDLIKDLRNNMYNYFWRICVAHSDDAIWTVFKDYKQDCQPRGYAKGFVNSACRATNEYKNTYVLAYGVNYFVDPFIKNYFTSNYVEFDDDLYALSAMVQWIWRSAIRAGKDINIYIPSSRMRGLLNDWLDNKYVKNS